MVVLPIVTLVPLMTIFVLYNCRLADRGVGITIREPPVRAPTLQDPKPEAVDPERFSGAVCARTLQPRLECRTCKTPNPKCPFTRNRTVGNKPLSGIYLFAMFTRVEKPRHRASTSTC